MEVKWTLTDDMPTYCVGLFDTREEAEAAKEKLGIPRFCPTPILKD